MTIYIVVCPDVTDFVCAAFQSTAAAQEYIDNQTDGGSYTIVEIYLRDNV